MKDFLDLLERIWKELKPPRAFSWQTMILLSLFSWIMSLLVEADYVRDALATMGWLFLTLGVGWLLSGQKINLLGVEIYPGPWITGALICGLIFEGFTDQPTSVAFVSWPIISATIASFGKFLKPGPVFTTPTRSGRQELVILYLTNMIISCWFGFHFLLQDWLRDYPSILVDDFNPSAFVVKLRSEDDISRGVPFLDLAASILDEELEGRSWADVELWLLPENLETEIEMVEAQVKDRISPLEENSLWRLQAQVLPRTEYTLVLRAIWQGPSSKPRGYFLEKACLIAQAPQGETIASGAIAQVDCQPTGLPTFPGSDE